LSNERYEEIKETVVEMFEEYGVSCVPINGFEIANKMGVKVIPYSAFPARVRYLMEKYSIDGFSVLRDTGEWYIYYNDDDEHDYGRINNTIMHEVAHIVLDHTEDSELAEAEVRFFAKYALAPPVLIHKLKLETAESIADIFEISFEAAGYALAYYQKWLNYGGHDYKDYEIRMLRLFDLAV
jgi:Zn-dependent peptidase ImmA (M78 family)